MIRARHLALAALLWLAGLSGACAQGSVALWCLNPSGSSANNNLYQPCALTNPLITNSTATADTTATGSITTTQNVPITTTGQSTVGIQITGTWTGNVVFEGTVDGVNWLGTTGVSLTAGTSAGNATANGIFQANAAGLVGFRVRGSNVATGTAIVTMRASTGVSTIMSDNPLVIAQPLGITPTDHTITSASGSSQTLMAANGSRHSMTVVNTGNANCGVNPTNGTAAIGGAGTLTLVPNGAYTPRVPTLTAVTVICTAGQPIYADDN